MAPITETANEAPTVFLELFSAVKLPLSKFRRIASEFNCC